MNMMKSITPQTAIVQAAPPIMANGQPIKRIMNKIIEASINNEPIRNLKKCILSSFVKTTLPMCYNISTSYTASPLVVGRFELPRALRLAVSQTQSLCRFENTPIFISPLKDNNSIKYFCCQQHQRLISTVKIDTCGK